MSKLSGEYVIELKFSFEFPNSVPEKTAFFNSTHTLIEGKKLLPILIVA